MYARFKYDVQCVFWLRRTDVYWRVGERDSDSWMAYANQMELGILDERPHKSVLLHADTFLKYILSAYVTFGYHAQLVAIFVFVILIWIM